MAKKICKCVVCKLEFDRNSIQAVRHGANRYAHATCEPNNTDYVPFEGENNPELQELKSYIAELLKEPNWAMITKQIKKYHDEDGYSYSGIQKSLEYFYKIKGNPIDKANNAIGIVPYCYQAAYNYYLAIFMANHTNEDVVFTEEVKEYTIKNPVYNGTSKRLLDWSIDDEE